ncbi:2'-5' RNA ligase family protein [Rhizosaccharibacter radicis]|uniref:2'-5' RNA ligase family protein n=1 Tax=Rhizosaccharibacter radicis TaxID=2782605 RepID=A0ABT1W1U5_9PROT|nr:2'-5' RNA ligase family protein [Acetobacteraceae bacterium KSS12]
MTTQQIAPLQAPSGAPPGGPGKARLPLLLTLELAQPGRGVLQALRNRLFPPERNVVPAHVSLFHHLPGEALGLVRHRLEAVEDARMVVTVDPPRFTGRGVSFPLRAAALVGLRAALAESWSHWLTPQDRQKFQPHVTVQNKVSPEEARAAHARLSTGFVPWSTEGTALLLWRYLGIESGGRWEALNRYPLAEPPADDAQPENAPPHDARPRRAVPVGRRR